MPRGLMPTRVMWDNQKTLSASHPPAQSCRHPETTITSIRPRTQPTIRKMPTTRTATAAYTSFPRFVTDISPETAATPQSASPSLHAGD
ncbi:hypothetical protein BD309DRAFT_955972 [Dichomitus squalens]|uniref:Uncharacterized protein n=1 Tax=Dichomitus squalens TaxID=114155 RepID=A0A4Q9PWH4_9APHY|nr:hypothetical protein BD309DRAFT_955972 [Dichomitus squalens]TBU59032.1 hypothetical protein BD310DRAFT_925954 [Dichomitus squalens]